MKNNTLKSTGERMIPKLNEGTVFYYEHLNRYYFSSQFCQDKKVLDIACGSGYGSYILADYGKAKSVQGLDISSEAISYAKQNYKKTNLSFDVDDATKIKKIKDNSIEVVVSFETIEHISDQETFLNLISKKIKKNGLFIISTPNILTYPKGNPFHIKELSQIELENILKKYFKNIKIIAQKYYISNQINQNQSNNKIIQSEQNFAYTSNGVKNCEYLIALCSNIKLPNYRDYSISVNKIEGINFDQGFQSYYKENQNLINQIKKNDQIILDYKLENENLILSLKKIQSSKTYKIWQKYNKIKKIFNKSK